jgi:hypothetical protein
MNRIVMSPFDFGRSWIASGLESADPSPYSNVERAAAKSTGSAIFMELSDKGTCADWGL